jgi:hypothetical protein
MPKYLTNWILSLTALTICYYLMEYVKNADTKKSYVQLEQNTDVIAYGKILSIVQYNQPDYFLVYFSNDNQYLLYTKNSNIIISEIHHYIDTKAILRLVLDGERYSQVGNQLIKSIELVRY